MLAGFQRVAVAAAGMAMLLGAQAVRADVWAFVDSDGRVRYTSTQPTDPRYQKVTGGGEKTVPAVRPGVPAEALATTTPAPTPGTRVGASPMVAGWAPVMNEPGMGMSPVSTPPSPLGRRRGESFEDWAARFDASPAVQALQPVLSEAAKTTGVDPLLLKAVIAVESGFNPLAMSEQGALGLMQIMPDTAERYASAAERQRPVLQRMMEPRTNVLTGARMLADLSRRFDRIDHVLAAWNAGEGNVRKHGGMPPIDQTRQHALQVLELYMSMLERQRPVAGR